MSKILGPLPCINCGVSVVWMREDGRFRLTSPRNFLSHRCKVADKALPIASDQRTKSAA